MVLVRGMEGVEGGPSGMEEEGRCRVVLVRGKERMKGGPNEGEGECEGWSW